MRLFVANINFDATEDDLRAVFIASGFSPRRVWICADRETGNSRGFGFVVIDRLPDGYDAIAALHGTEMRGRRLVVQEARPREDSPVGAVPAAA